MPIFVETYRATVAPADCDHLAHMNVQHYFAAASDGMFGIMVRLGLGPEEIRRRQMAFAVVHAETDFHHELHPGDVVALESTVLKLGEKSANFGHRLKNVATGNIAMSTEFKCVLLDLEKREATSIPDDIRAAAAQLIASHGDLTGRYPREPATCCWLRQPRRCEGRVEVRGAVCLNASLEITASTGRLSWLNACRRDRCDC